MKKPVITIVPPEEGFIVNIPKEEIDNLKKIKDNGELSEYGFKITLSPNYKKIRPNDIILITRPQIDVYCKVIWAAVYNSGKQEIQLRYEDIIVKEQI